MSAGRDRAFGPLLQEVGLGPAMPLPTRTRILQELDADLQDLTERFVAEGMEPAAARRRAQEALVPDGEAVSALGRIHESRYRRFTRRLPEGRVLILERSALLASTGAIVVVQGALLVTTDLLAYASPFLWPVLGLGSVMAILGLWKAFELWVKGDHTRLHRGLDGLLGLSVATVLVGASGVVLDLSRLAAMLEADPGLLDSILLFWLIRDAGLLAVALVLALAGGLAWFGLRQWVIHVEAAHREVVGASVHPTRGGLP